MWRGHRLNCDFCDSMIYKITVAFLDENFLLWLPKYLVKVHTSYATKENAASVPDMRSVEKIEGVCITYEALSGQVGNSGEFIEHSG